MIVAVEPGKLKLGKGAAFVKSRLKRLPQQDETWEADFQTLPKRTMQTATHYFGQVVTRPDGFLLADLFVERTPTVNDLAKLLADAMKRPLTDDPHRPRRILLRKNPRWVELLRQLEEIGVEPVVQDELPTVEKAFVDLLHHMQAASSARAVEPTAEQQAGIENVFPAVAAWIGGGYGHIEVGQQEEFGFVARAVGCGGVVIEDDTTSTLVGSMAALEAALARWFECEGIEIGPR